MIHSRTGLSIFSAVAILLGLAAGAMLRAEDAEGGGKFSLVRTGVGYELKTPDGRTVFQYMTVKPKDSKLTANSTCCFYPVYTPKGTRVVDFAPDDHPHHRGIFLAWHNMQGEPGGDFWGWGKFAPTEGRVIRNKSVELLRELQGSAILGIKNEWMAGDTVMMKEEVGITVEEKPGAYVIRLLFRLTPTNDLTLGQTAFSGFNVKSRKSKGVYADPQGVVERPNPHHLKPETDWPSRAWYDYSFELDDGTRAGVAVVDSKSNPTTAWHNVKPIAMLNPCIVAPAEVRLKAGEKFDLEYKLVVHDGPAPVEVIERVADGFAKE